MKGFFITGTDTEIGKTLITSLLTFGLQRQGINCCPVKPVATGGVQVEDQLVSEDVLTYKTLTGIDEPEGVLNPVCYKRPASPHFAAELENTTIGIKNVFDSLTELSERYEFLLVEGIGGWKVPVTYDYLVSDFAKELGLPVILVSALKLGTLNHTLLSIDSIRSYGLELAGVIFTSVSPEREADLDKNNIDTIRKIAHVDILGVVPYIETDLFKHEKRETLWESIRETILWHSIMMNLDIQKK